MFVTDVEAAICSAPPGRISFVFTKIRDPALDNPEEIAAALTGVDPMAEVNDFGAELSDAEAGGDADSDDEPLVHE